MLAGLGKAFATEGGEPLRCWISPFRWPESRLRPGACRRGISRMRQHLPSTSAMNKRVGGAGPLPEQLLRR
jgi:hypothetical protein